MLVFVGFETFCLKIWKLENNSDNVHWNVRTNTKALYARNNIVKKRIPNMRFWIIYILVQILFFATALGRFSQFFLKIFLSSAQPWQPKFLLSLSPTIKSFLLWKPKCCNIKWKTYVLSTENNKCNVIKFLFLSIIFYVKLKKKTYFRTKKEIFFINFETNF